MPEDNDDKLGEWQWAIGRVLSNWRKLRPKQLRDALPGSFSSPRLRLIRANACRQTAHVNGVPIDCAKWGSRPLANKKVQHEIFLCTGAYVCDQCKHPMVTNSSLIERLGLTHDDEEFSERTWRRYVNDA